MKPLFIILFLASSLLAQPWSPEVIWDRSGLQDSSLYGYEILPLGDQNDDGFDDWAVAAGGNRIVVGNQWPYVEFFHGGNPPSNIPYMTIFGPSNLWGWGMAGILNDVNGDGYVDWFTKRRSESFDYCIVDVFWGGNAADTIPEYSLLIGRNDYFGTVGDFNGDEQSDLFWYHTIPDYIDIFYGNNIIDWIPDWSRTSPSGNSYQALPQSYGDLNDDGYSDWVSATLMSNTTYIFLGNTYPDTIPAYTWPNMRIFPEGIVNDLNANRCDELIYTYQGGADVHLGGSVLHSVADVQLSYPCGSGAEVVASLGDINADGFKDMALIRSYCPGSWWGVLSLYLGQSALNSQPAWTIYGRGWQNLVSLQTAAGLGDVNGDGIDDFAIGAWDDLDTEGWRGRCIVVAGDTS